MKITTSQLRKMVQEELEAVYKEKLLRKEHRGIPCDKKTGIEKLECERAAKEAVERSQNNHQKKRDYSANDEELEALARNKIHGNNVPLRTRKNQIKPKNQVNPDIGKELTERRRKTPQKQCTSRADKKGHNAYHDDLGRFSSKKDAVTKSVRNRQSQNCKYAGQSKHNPHQWIKGAMKCGRKDRLNPNIKAKYRCKDGKEIREQLLQSKILDNTVQMYDTGDYLIIRSDIFEDLIEDIIRDMMEDFREEIEGMTFQMSENSNSLQTQCERAGYRTFQHFLQAFNSLILSSKGELNKPQK